MRKSLITGASTAAGLLLVLGAGAGAASATSDTGPDTPPTGRDHRHGPVARPDARLHAR